MKTRNQGIVLLCGGVAGVLLGSSVAAGGARGMAPVSSCRNDADCGDGVYCNGQERCLHVGARNALTGANARGCAAASNTPCAGTGLACFEIQRRCAVLPVDADGDGHASIATGGDDCDDGDASRYPGNPERSDPRAPNQDSAPPPFHNKHKDPT